LDRQIRLVQPKFIVTLGNHSTACIFSKARLSFSSITQDHGKFYDASISDMNVTIFATFHPAAALYSGRYREQISKDFKMLRRELEKRGTIKQFSK